MYFAKVFRTPFSKHLYKVVSNNVQSRWFIKCFQITSKLFVKFYVVLSNFVLTSNSIFEVNPGVAKLLRWLLEIEKYFFVFKMYNIVCADKKSCFLCLNGYHHIILHWQNLQFSNMNNHNCIGSKTL